MSNPLTRGEVRSHRQRHPTTNHGPAATRIRAYQSDPRRAQQPGPPPTQPTHTHPTHQTRDARNSHAPLDLDKRLSISGTGHYGRRRCSRAPTCAMRDNRLRLSLLHPRTSSHVGGGWGVPPYFSFARVRPESSSGTETAPSATMQKPAEPGDRRLLVVGSTGSEKASGGSHIELCLGTCVRRRVASRVELSAPCHGALRRRRRARRRGKAGLRRLLRSSVGWGRHAVALRLKRQRRRRGPFAWEGAASDRSAAAGPITRTQQSRVTFGYCRSAYSVPPRCRLRPLTDGRRSSRASTQPPRPTLLLGLAERRSRLTPCQARSGSPPAATAAAPGGFSSLALETKTVVLAQRSSIDAGPEALLLLVRSDYVEINITKTMLSERLC
jgi:hypothetical protein